MQHSETIGKIAEALSKAQAGFDHVEKDGKSHHGKYATLASVLETVRAGLGEHGLSIIQAPGTEGSMVTVTTRLMHSSGEWLETTVSAPAATDIQKLGSAISYLRRYSLMAVLSLAADDDDDGNTAMKGPQGGQRQQSRPNTPPAPTQTTLNAGQAQTLHKRLGAALQDTPYREMTHNAFAAQVLGREVGSLTDLSVAEAKQVQEAAQKAQTAA